MLLVVKVHEEKYYPFGVVLASHKKMGGKSEEGSSYAGITAEGW
jgi:hypothetical protein